MLVSTLLLHQIPGIKKVKEEGEGGKKAKRREKDGERKVNFKKGTIILAQVPDDSVPSHMALLLLGTEKEKEHYCVVNFMKRRCSTCFFRKFKDKDPKSQSKFSTWFYLKFSISFQYHHIYLINKD